MKKLLSVILALLITLSLPACGKPDTTRTYASLPPFSLTPTTNDLQTSGSSASLTPVQSTVSAPPTTVPGGCSINTVYVSGQDSTYGSYKGAGSYAKGGKVTLTATPVKDGGFLGWASDAKGTKIVSYYNPYTFSVSKDVTLYPVFIKGSDKVTLKDEAVKEAVKEATGSQQSSYTYAELQTITELTIRWGVAPNTLVDLVYFHSAKDIFIDFGNKYIDIAPLAGLTNLQILYLIDAAVKDSDLDYLPVSIEDLKIYNCTNLKDLNRITKLKNLRSLTVSECWISDVTYLGQMKQLEILYLEDNLISVLSPLLGLTNLKELGLSNNRITDLTPLKPLYSKNKNLGIYISFNPIKDYSFLNDAVCRFDNYVEGSDFFLTNDQMKQTAAAAQDMVNNLIQPGMSDYEKYKALVIGLCGRVTYNYENKNHFPYAYGALVEGSAVCQGYAEAYMMLCTMAGLPCYDIGGISRGIGHAWNIVKLDGKYYHVDVTWIDNNDIYPRSAYYFLKSDTFFLENDHTDFERAPELVCNNTSRDGDVGIINYYE